MSRLRSRGSSLQADVPSELRIFSHHQFDAQEYVTSVCREASTSEGFLLAERKLEALRASAEARLLRGADAETYGNARRKIEATVAEVGAARAALRGTLAALDAYEASIPR